MAKHEQQMARDRDLALRIRDLSELAPIPAPGLYWRSCRVAPQTADHAVQRGVRVDLPADLTGALPARRAEFLGGRLCATLALRDAGGAGRIGRAGRAPVWPAGFMGSITHAQGRILAVARRGRAGTGLDLAPVFPATLAAELLPRIGVGACPPGWSAARHATLIFSAKEALYKALCAGLPDIPDFREADQVRITRDRVVLRFRGGLWPVRFRFVDTSCVTLALAEAEAELEVETRLAQPRAGR